MHHNEHPSLRKTAPRCGWRSLKPAAGFGAAVAILGLLLWARLLLVTGHPRTAVASPDKRHATPPAAPSQRP